MSSTTFNDKPFVVRSPDVTYTDDEMVSKYTYQVYGLFVFDFVVIFMRTASRAPRRIPFVPERSAGGILRLFQNIEILSLLPQLQE